MSPLPKNLTDSSSPHPEEACRAVSKDAPAGSGASWSILRDAADAAPQDEGSGASEPDSREALRRGWCPSTLRPMETGDGWLVRLHPPGNALTPGQLRRVAELAEMHGNGLIEISARANLQLRGVSAQTHPALVEALLAEHLVDETEHDGPQKLVLTSPLAGHDPSELIDAAALAREIGQHARMVAGLPAKAGVIVDGGGLSLDDFAADLRVVAAEEGKIAIGLPDDTWLGPVTPSDAADAVIGLLHGLAAGRRAEPSAIRRLRDLPPAGLAKLIEASGLPMASAPQRCPAPARAGLFALRDGRFAAIIGLPFGRSDAGTLAEIADIAGRNGSNEIRCSPWRGLAFLGLDQKRAEAVLAAADALGLITQDMDPRLSVQACAGAPACSRGETPASGDAAVLAEAAAPLLASGLTLHVSGCVKSCAHPAAADLTLVGHDGRYDLVFNGTTRDTPTQRLDLSQIVQRLQPGQDFHTRLITGRASGPKV
ncbi:precorrin-3B synthase [Bosea caraganae]|uniref:Precorrin-3B synthase n=1 Tax=Bosea caraganae TaxID=2763117 RepID=A0A370L7V8_9HYPH|nr:precorrin-3B synthase [Bosea caraganae]RDJ25129.1 precorrin-3B synthase [Bosea caraganae]RDJ26239.1 precorrin-3B synthase [Bosea caraganae]